MATITKTTEKAGTAVSFLPVRPTALPYKRDDVRFPQNIVKSIDTLFDLFDIADDDADNNLRRSIIYYLCYNYQTDLFAYSTFDPRKFAETMDFTENWLNRKHAKPLCLEEVKHLPQEEQDALKQQGMLCYTSNLGNALYSLLKKEVFLSRGAKFYNGDNKKNEIVIREDAKMSILQKLTIETQKSGKTGQLRTKYSVTMDDKFLHDLTKYFIRGDLKALVALRKTKLDILYAKLLEIRHYAVSFGHGHSDIESFEALCNWCRIPSLKKDGSEMEARERKKLVLKAFKKINDITQWGFGIEPIKGDKQKFAYTFRVHWNLPKNFEELKARADTEDRQQLFEQCLYREFIAYFRMVKSPDNPLQTEHADFDKWMRTDTDRDEKLRIYLLVSDRIYGQESAESKKFQMRERGFGDFQRMLLGKKDTKLTVGYHKMVADGRFL